MARASVELIVEAAKAVNPLRKVQQESKKVDQALKKNQKAARDVEAAFQRMGRRGIRSFRDLESNAAKLGKRMGGLRGAIGKAAIGLVAFKAGQAALARIESVRRLQRLGGAYGEVAALQDAATEASKTFGLSQTEANQQFSQIYARLRPVGVTLEDIKSTFVGFNTVARLSGATSVEASNAFTQHAQALGSGALRGDEFNSISEQVPGILTAISKETGVAQGSLRKYAAEGKITSDIVMKALKRIEKEGAAGLEDAMDGPAQAFKNFKNTVDDILVALGEDSIPEVVRLINHISDAINALKPVIEGVGSFAATVIGGVADAIERIRDPNKLAREQQEFFETGRNRNKMNRGMFSSSANLQPGYKEDELLFSGKVDQLRAQQQQQRKKPTFNTLPPTGDKKRDDTAAAQSIVRQRQNELAVLKQTTALGKELQQLEFNRSEELRKINGFENISAELRQEAIDRMNESYDAQKGSVIGEALAQDVLKAEALTQAQNDTLRPLNQQIELLEAKLNGNEREVRLRQQEIGRAHV